MKSITKKEMNRITSLFEKKKTNLLSVFFTAGFPALEDALVIAKSLEESGADLIEIGIPFSDPVADGPVIQESNKIALQNGMTLKVLLTQVKAIRKEVNLPIILMGYINPVLQFGFDRFCKEAAQAGVDGLILPDLPLDEYQNEYRKSVEGNNLKMTFLISPTTSDERIRKIDAAATGFVYAVSASSTTGTREGFSEEQESYFKRIGEMKLSNPFLIGFGISDKETFNKACRYGAGAIIGSAFIRALKESGDLKEGIKAFVKSVKE